MSPALSTPIPAATLILFRERAEGPPELMFTERSAAMQFAAGALVFPGGRVDAQDYVLAAAYGDADDADWDAAARIAAIRETLEEVGLGVGVAGLGDPAGVRAALHDGRPLGALLDEAGARIQPDALVPFARWCPNLPHARIFDTRFYLARLPDGAADHAVDGTENVRAFWATARDVLAQVEAGAARMIFPTRRTVERLATYASFDAAVADARRHPVRTITPWIEARDGDEYLHIPDDLGFPVTSARLADAFRT